MSCRTTTNPAFNAVRWISVQYFRGISCLPSELYLCPFGWHWACHPVVLALTSSQGHYATCLAKSHLCPGESWRTSQAAAALLRTGPLTQVLLPSVLTPSFLCPGATAQLFFSLKAGRQQSATLLTPILLGKVQKRVICQAPHWEILSGPYSWTNRCDSGSLYEEPTSTMMTTTEGRGGNVNAKTSPKVTV